MRAKRTNSLWHSTAGLALAGIVSKVLGALYRVPLTNALGAEGIGLYQTFFPVYALFLTIVGAAVPTVVGRYVAYADALGADIPHTRAAAKRISFILGITGAIAAATLALPVAALQARPQIWKGYLIVAPAVFAVTLAAYFKGYFIGKGRMTANALSQTAEQAVKLAVGLTLAFVLADYGAEIAVYGALAAVTVSEFAGLALMCAAYRKEKLDEINFRTRVDKRIYYDIVKAALPITAAALVLPVSGFLDSFLIVRLLTAGGSALDAATAQYGLYSGAVGTVVNLPVVIAVSLAVAVIPKVSSGVAKGEFVRVNEATGLTLGAGLAVSVPCFFALLVFAGDVVSVLYPGFSGEELAGASAILRYQAVNVVAASMVQLLSGILQALGSGKSAAAYLALSVAFKTVLQVVLVPRIGIVAAPLAQFSAYALAAALSLVRYTELVGKNSQLVKTSSKIVLGGVIMSVCIQAVALTVNGRYARIAVGAVVGAVVYFLLLWSTKAFGERGIRAAFSRGKGENND